MDEWTQAEFWQARLSATLLTWEDRKTDQVHVARQNGRDVILSQENEGHYYSIVAHKTSPAGVGLWVELAFELLDDANRGAPAVAAFFQGEAQGEEEADPPTKRKSAP